MGRVNNKLKLKKLNNKSGRSGKKPSIKATTSQSPNDMVLSKRVSPRQKPKTSGQTRLSTPETAHDSFEERLVPVNNPVPPGYIFVPKGNVYITRNCRSRTREHGQKLYVVHAIGQPNRTLGLCVPTLIAEEVNDDALATDESRAAAVQAKDQKDLVLAEQMLKKLYPRLPSQLVRPIIDHGFKKSSGRVGRAGNLDLHQRVRLAVQAHARHKHTKYDHHLQTMERDAARVKVRTEIEELLRVWSGQTKKVTTPPSNPKPMRPQAQSRSQGDKVTKTKLTVSQRKQGRIQKLRAQRKKAKTPASSRNRMMKGKGNGTKS